MNGALMFSHGNMNGSAHETGAFGRLLHSRRSGSELWLLIDATHQTHFTRARRQDANDQ